MTDLLAPGMEKAIKFIQNLEEKDLKEKVNIGAWGKLGGGGWYQIYWPLGWRKLSSLYRTWRKKISKKR